MNQNMVAGAVFGASCYVDTRKSKNKESKILNTSCICSLASADSSLRCFAEPDCIIQPSVETFIALVHRVKLLVKLMSTS